MKAIGILILLTWSLFGAEIDRSLLSEDNVSARISEIRLSLANESSADERRQNEINIQKLFLSKIEALAHSLPQTSLKQYPFTSESSISQHEFIDYFNAGAGQLEKMFTYEKNIEQLGKRLQAIEDNLGSIPPGDTSAILQGQLEYAYFKWKKNHNQYKYKEYHDFLDKEKSRFLYAFANVKLDVEALDKLSTLQNVQLQKLYQKKVYLELRLEKETILAASKTTTDETEILDNKNLIGQVSEEDKTSRFEFLQDELLNVKQNISEKIQEKTDTFILLQLHNLKSQDLEQYIIVREMMQSFAPDLSAEAKTLFDIQLKMLEWLKYEEIDELTTIIYDFKEWAERAYVDGMDFMNTPLFYKDERAIVLLDFIKMFITIIIGFLIAAFYKRRINLAQKRIGFVQKQSFKIIGNIGYYIIVLITFAISLNNIGLDLSSLSLVAGALSVGIGFGLKEIVGNLVSGLILMIERSVKIGDFVEIENGVSGNIIDIRMRSVTVRTPANIDVIVPNSSLVQRSFINYTLEEPIRRLDIPFMIAYGVKFEEVKTLIMTALEESDLEYIRNSKEYQTKIIMSGMDERGINCKLLVYVNTYGPDVQSPFLMLIYRVLQDNVFPLPTARLSVSMSEGQP